jgi:hypothetical protein
MSGSLHKDLSMLHVDTIVKCSVVQQQCKKGTNCFIPMSTLNSFTWLTATSGQQQYKGNVCCVPMATVVLRICHIVNVIHTLYVFRSSFIIDV